MAPIPNYYKNIEHDNPDLLIKPFNPNHHLHGMNLPFRSCIVAPSGSGKTNFLVHLIHLFSQGKRGTFADITICTRNKDEPLYNWLVEKSEGSIRVLEGLHSLPKLDQFDKRVNHLVVVDDLVLDKNQQGVSDYYIRARKLNVSVVYISQKFHLIPPIIRGNCSYFCLLKLSGKREINLILSEFGLGVTKEQLFDLYQRATAERFQPLVVDMDAPPEKRFRAGLDDVLEI